MSRPARVARGLRSTVRPTGTESFAGKKIDYANGRALVSRSVIGLEEDDDIEVTTKMLMAFGE